MLKKLTMLLLVYLIGISSPIHAGIVDTINAPVDYCLSTWYSHLGFIAGGVGGMYASSRYFDEDMSLEHFSASIVLSAFSLFGYHLLRVMIPSVRCVGLLVPMIFLTAVNFSELKRKSFIGTGSVLCGSVVCAAAVNAIIQKAILYKK
jgi:predicted membrane-bound mannosyltransferase